MKHWWQHKILVLGFAVILCLPMVRIAFNVKEETPAARRFLSGINAYYSDHLGFRSELLALYRFCKMSLSVNPFPEKVVRGDGQWYFLGDSYGDVIKESKGIISFSEDELGRIKNNIVGIDRDCRLRGIRFYVAVAPNKHSVYGRYLPIVKSGHPTKLEQLTARLARRNLNLIDLKRDFPLHRDKRLFYFHDTHWNDFGGFIGYRTLMDFIVRDFPGLQVLSWDDFKLDTVKAARNDLTAMLSMKIQEDEVIMKPVFLSNTQQERKCLPLPENYSRNPDEYEIRFVNSNRPLKVLIFRDSFFDALIPFVRESFGHSVFIWSDYNQRLLDIEKPDLVICEVIERDIDNFDPGHP